MSPLKFENGTGEAIRYVAEDDLHQSVSCGYLVEFQTPSHADDNV